MKLNSKFISLYAIALVLGIAMILVPALLTHTALSNYFLQLLPLLYLLSTFLGFYLRKNIFTLLGFFVVGQFLGYVSAEYLYPTPFQNWIIPPILAVPIHSIPLFILGGIGSNIFTTKNEKKPKMTIQKFIILFLLAMALPVFSYFN